MIIRPVLHADIPAIAEVHVLSWRAAYRNIVPPAVVEGLTISECAESWHAQVSDDARTDLLCETDGRLVGFVSFGPCRDDDTAGRSIGEIYGLYLAPEFWGRGFGKSLCDRAIVELTGRGLGEINLWVLDDNKRARTFYEAAGFSLDADRQKVVQRWGADLLHVCYRRGARRKHETLA